MNFDQRDNHENLPVTSDCLYVLLVICLFDALQILFSLL